LTRSPAWFKLKVVFNFKVREPALRRLLVFLSLLVSASAGAAPVASDDVRRLAAILDYVAADYGGAVKDGKVLDEGEYREQQSFMADAAVLAARVPGADVAEVEALVAAKADPARVAEVARALRRRLLDEHGLVLAPAAPPSRERARELYAQSCAPCHGARGAGDGPAGMALKPPPRSFLDAGAMAGMSPVRAFNALTDGMKGTAMPSWSALSSADRWSLAFYVLTLRQDPAAAARGRSAVARPPLAELAARTDAELAAAGPEALAYLRVEAPFVTTGAPLDDARRGVAAVVAAYRRGDAPGARAAAGQAYLDGFEPHEGALRARAAELTARCEEHFLRLRELVGAGAPVDAVEKEALQLGALLDRAEEALGTAGGAVVAFFSATAVILREGFEAALLILLLLGLARRGGDETHARAGVRAVHAGWLAALGVGIATWIASGPLVTLGGASRELMEGIVSLLAAAVLLVTGHFVIARIDAKHRVDAMKRRLAQSSRRGSALAGLAFIAVYREAFEVVLFLRAIALDGNTTQGAVVAGAGAGALLLIGVVAALAKLGRRLKPGPLLATMGTLLCVLAVILAGKGVRALQEAGIIGIRPLEVPRLEWIGLFPSVEGVLTQLAVLAAFGAIALVAVRARKRDAMAVSSQA
jgi:high-affinity iron transporter